MRVFWVGLQLSWGGLCLPAFVPVESSVHLPCAFAAVPSDWGGVRSSAALDAFCMRTGAHAGASATAVLVGCCPCCLHSPAWCTGRLAFGGERAPVRTPGGRRMWGSTVHPRRVEQRSRSVARVLVRPPWPGSAARVLVMESCTRRSRRLRRCGGAAAACEDRRHPQRAASLLAARCCPHRSSASGVAASASGACVGNHSRAARGLCRAVSTPQQCKRVYFLPGSNRRLSRY